MIERKKFHKRRSNGSHRRSGAIRPGGFEKNNVPKSRGGLLKAFDRYTTMAQDATSNGDRIVAENYYQYAEHYQRLINQINPNEKLKSNNNSSQNTEEKIDINKPSRTERAINAKNERISKVDSDQKQTNQQNSNEKSKEKFTSDGLEALKPFEFSMDEKKT